MHEIGQSFQPGANKHPHIVQQLTNTQESLAHDGRGHGENLHAELTDFLVKIDGAPSVQKLSTARFSYSACRVWHSACQLQVVTLVRFADSRSLSGL